MTPAPALLRFRRWLAGRLRAARAWRRGRPVPPVPPGFVVEAWPAVRGPIPDLPGSWAADAREDHWAAFSAWVPPRCAVTPGRLSASTRDAAAVRARALHQLIAEESPAVGAHVIWFGPDPATDAEPTALALVTAALAQVDPARGRFDPAEFAAVLAARRQYPIIYG